MSGRHVRELLRAGIGESERRGAAARHRGVDSASLHRPRQGFSLSRFALIRRQNGDLRDSEHHAARESLGHAAVNSLRDERPRNEAGRGPAGRLCAESLPRPIRPRTHAGAQENPGEPVHHALQEPLRRDLAADAVQHGAGTHPGDDSEVGVRPFRRRGLRPIRILFFAAFSGARSCGVRGVTKSHCRVILC